LKTAKSTAKVLGIDEPFKGLSPHEIYLVASYFDRIRAKGKTIVVVDHSEEAAKYFGYGIVLGQENRILIELNIPPRQCTKTGRIEHRFRWD
jgi:energy-coupling factor transporter ATP-binding protein EcfA2